MSRWLLVLPVLGVALAPSRAWALKPDKHRSYGEAACTNAGLPEPFCRRMGAAVYETDAEEWDDLSAHAQSQRGQSLCAAADAAHARVDALAREVVASAQAHHLDAAAVALGRALHTLQDECAHHGMTNEQHAFYSLEQTCGESGASPDVRPAALACAQQRSATVMRAVADALAGIDWSGVNELCQSSQDPGSQSDRDACTLVALPTPFQACDFLAEYKDWDGLDSTWNADVVGPALEAAFAAGLRGGVATATPCGADPHAIDPRSPAAAVANHDVSCGLTDLGCLGKVDGETGPVSPYGDPPTPPVGTAGCAVTAAPGWAVLALLAGSRRRRRAPR